MKRRMIALLSAAAMTASIMPAAMAAEDTKDVVVSVEAATLGIGYIVEPTIVTVDKDASSSEALMKAMDDVGIAYKGSKTGNVVNYYTAVQSNGRTVDIPQRIMDEFEDEDGYFEYDGEVEDSDYISMHDYCYDASGWMVTVDNEFINIGLNEHVPDESAVIRMQYSVINWGGDLGAGAEYGFDLEDVEYANKDDLNMYIAMLRSQYDDELLKSIDAYNNAITAGETFGISQEEVDAALEDAMMIDFDDIEAPIDVRTPYLAAQETLRANNVVWGSEWNILAVARGEYPASDEANADFYNTYLDSVKSTLESTDGGLKTAAAATDFARTIIGVTAAGADASKIAGYNLFDKLADYSFAAKNLNGAVYTLIALDTHDYEFPQTDAANKSTRENLIEFILGKAVSAGGWAFFGTNPDPDMTSMAIQALAPYYGENDDVTAAVDKALAKLSTMQREDGTYASYGTANAESTAQILGAISSLGIDADTDERFIKNGITLPEAVTAFAADGGYAHTLGGNVNNMATQQAAYSLAAYYRFKNGGNTLYDMTDIVFPTEVFEAAQAQKGELFNDPEKGAFAQTYTAEIDLDSFETISGLNWIITNTAGETATVQFESPVLTEGSYVYGLIVDGTEEQLDTITDVKLVNAE